MSNKSNNMESFVFQLSNSVPYESENLTQQGQNGVCVFATGSTFTSFKETKATPHVILKNIELKTQFEVNFNIWNNRTYLMANNDFSDENFKAIVDMGEQAVPYIKEEIAKGPTPLVHALDLIFPNMVEYEGYIPLPALCNLWLLILK